MLRTVYICGTLVMGLFIYLVKGGFQGKTVKRHLRGWENVRGEGYQ